MTLPPDDTDVKHDTSIATAIDALLRQPPVGLILVRPSVPLFDDDERRMSLVEAAIAATLQRLADMADARDLVVAIQSDLVLLVRPALTAPAETEGLARRLHTELSQPMIIDDQPIRCSINIGVAVSAPADTGAKLLGYARRALEDARTLGGNQVLIFDDPDRELLEPPGRSG